MVSRALAESNSGVEEVIIHTGQHYDANMSQVFFDELEIPHPKYNLGIGGGSHGENTGRMIESIEKVLLKERPTWLLVYGDTDSTLAAAIAASKISIPIAHVEAGLRSFNRLMPEEVNRVVTDHVADILFTPTTSATAQLVKEGIPAQKIHQVGDVMHDAALHFAMIAKEKSDIICEVGLQEKKYILVTLHRQENTDNCERLTEILSGLSSSQLPVVWPMHPRTQARLEQFGLQVPDIVRVIKPVGYLDMIMLEKNACLIATDSGGVQKEAFFYSVPCLTLRDETEWVELVNVGANRLVEAKAEVLAAELRLNRGPVSNRLNLYGGGAASVEISSVMVGGH